MRILPFDAYGSVVAQGVAQDPKERNLSLLDKVSEEIARNEAMRLALIAIADREQEKKKKQHRYKILNRKQASVLLSQLKNLEIDFDLLQKTYPIDFDDQRKKREIKLKDSNTKRLIRIKSSAAQAIADAAEAWVIARNKGILDMASILFCNRDSD
ncbi:hypothetical protein CP10139811_0068 [Chlamydia ibidis]|uniref:Uncharacterized protein n=2 Tax=Chlamydia ibidis TaxID=1405396 RepID=S7KMJ3_9CHLA|nr:hypothetical protein [Chlamydia ibidis]EPP35665.1 hypothetical protein CP10139811_0068 [Chlamydia ibidis]EQM62659.1 hypothetical protein H359_0511 [Chlamydia ibidis 10-1398/6]